MKLSKNTLLEILEGDSSGHSLNPTQMAHLYVNSALLVAMTVFIKEQLWLQTREDERKDEVTTYQNFLSPYFEDELHSLFFLKDFIVARGAKNLKRINRIAQNIEAKTITMMQKCSEFDQKIFVIQSLLEMKDHFVNEEIHQQGRLQSEGHKGLRLYRSFDRLDELFKLDYQLDLDMEVDHETPERLYQQSGVGVQSGYSTILLALERVAISEGATLIDLGSGYGRVGLVFTLLRPDVNFIGYEHVAHRVDVSNKAAQFFGLQDKLEYVTQDLSLGSFHLPEAEIYYLYDPFTEETYSYILQQIVEVSKHKKIVVVTKGNASSWFTKISNENSWQSPELIDGGNLRIFRS